MPQPKNPSSNSGTTIADATAKTRSVIESLQARLAGDASTRAGQGTAVEQPESVEDLEKQLQAYFEHAMSEASHGSEGSPPRRTTLLDEVRSRVVDRVVDRILADWADPDSGSAQSALARQVMDRLAERVLEELQRNATSSQSG